MIVPCEKKSIDAIRKVRGNLVSEVSALFRSAES